MEHFLLREENILVGLDAADCDTALKKIINFLPPVCFKGSDRQKILKLLLLREQFGTTAIGQGIALPHCFSQEVREPIVAFGVCPDGVPYPSLDGRPVHFIFVLILPFTDKAEQLKRQILQNIKWFLGDRYLQERLRLANTAQEVLQLLVPENHRELVSGSLEI